MKNRNNQPAKKFLSKLTIFVLVFLFLFQPLAPIFAQQLDSGDTTIVNVPTDAPVVSVPQKDIKLDADSKPVEAENQPAQAPAALQEERANNQTQNSPLSQKLPEIDKNTGALNYNYSITVPPGRNNLQPDLALSYNSNLNEQNSIFGFGWTLNIPYIQRMNKTGTDILYSSSYFYSSLDGELSAQNSSSYIARTENGSFNKYTFSNNQWIVIAKNGIQYKFGYDASSRQDDPANPSNVYKWMLQEIRRIKSSKI